MDKSKIRILLVDDAGMVRVMLRRMLVTLGFTRTDEANGGREALSMIEASFAAADPYTLVLCDWMMDDVNGIQVLEACRRSPTTKGLPIIMVTAESEQKSIVAAMKAGASDYMVKPVTASALEAKIERILAKLGAQSA